MTKTLREEMKEFGEGKKSRKDCAGEEKNEKIFNSYSINDYFNWL